MSTYKLTYGRTYNLGNFESERIDIERSFHEDVPVEEAVRTLERQTFEMALAAERERDVRREGSGH